MARPTDRPKQGTPPPPPRSPFLPPAPRPQLPPAAPALQQRAGAGLVLALLSLITMLLIGNLERAVYVIGVALAVAVAALILTISALSAAKRDRTRRPRAAVAGAVLGTIGALFSAFALVGILIFWSQFMQYAQCMNSASTVATQNACQQQFNNSVSTQITLLGGSR
jgi:O-antigen ligase